jgi:hypothetical protein
MKYFSRRFRRSSQKELTDKLVLGIFLELICASLRVLRDDEMEANGAGDLYVIGQCPLW